MVRQIFGINAITAAVICKYIVACQAHPALVKIGLKG